MEPLFSMAFAAGFLGSGHCVGMCGGIVAALALLHRRDTEPPSAGLAFHLLYNLGRLTTYALIGLFAGWLGSALAYTRAFAPFTRAALVFSDLFVIVLGGATLFACGRCNLMRLDGAAPVRLMTTAVRAFNRLPRQAAALPLGLLMGFLPCGFLYAMVISAAQSASPRLGFFTMLAFGLGTGPALLLFGSLAGLLTARVRGGMLRAAGGVVLLMGVVNLIRHIRIFDWVAAAVPFKWLCCP